jgi:drug/metabolite transporter (DMT)-like permease
MLAFALLSWAGAYVAIKGGLAALGAAGFGSGAPMVLTILRFLLASVAYVPIVALRARRMGRRMLPDRSTWLEIALFGLFAVVGYHVALNFGEQTVGAGVASVIVALSPAVTALLVHILGWERVGIVGAAGIGIAFAGVFIVSALGSPHADLSLATLAGPALILVSPVSWSMATLLVKRLAGRVDMFTLTAVGTWLGTLVLLPWTPAGSLTHLARLSAAGWGLLAFLSLAATVFGYLAWNVALARYDTTKVASSLYAIPPLTMIIAWLTLGEVVTPWLAVGTAVIIGGVALVDRQRSKAE